jgi:site-specific DNA-methyltransferase (adenine-specific)
VYGKGKHESLEHARARTGSTHDGCKLRGPRQNESFAAAVVGLVEKRNKRSVWRIPTEAFADAHFATFPRKLVEPCILSGCPVGGVVLDPFAGSGTTGIVALEHGREFVGIELNPEYCRMAKRRIEEARPLFNRVEIDRTSNTKARRKRSCERHEGKDRA